MEVLSLEEAWNLLTALVGTERISPDKVGARHIVSVLCEWLGYLPLGLELVGRYLAENPDLSLGQMLKQLQAEQLQDQAIDLSQQPTQPPLTKAQRGLKAAFELTWRELDPMTHHVGCILSLFAPVDFRWEWVEFASHSLHWVEADVNRAKYQLCKWYFMQPVDKREGYFKIHPLIRMFLRNKLDELEPHNSNLPAVIIPLGNLGKGSERIQQNEPQLPYPGSKLKRAFAQVMVEIAQQMPDLLTPKDIESAKDVIPHLEEVAQTLTTVISNQDLLWLFDRLGSFYKAQGLYLPAEPWFVKCLSVAQAGLGDNHPAVATTLNNLAGLYYSQGRYNEAQSLYLQALELRKRLLGKEHPDVATTLNNLAGLYYSQRRYNEAQSLYLQALEIRKRLLGNCHPDVATSLNNLALLYYSQRRYSEAQPLCVEALELRKLLLGNDHPDVATTLNNLALLYDSQGQHTEAESRLVQALELSERVLGGNHPNTIIFRKNLTVLRARIRSRNSWLRILTKKVRGFV